MSKNPGYLVSWVDKEGAEQFGIIVRSEQKPEFSKYNKVLIRKVNENHTPKLDENGKQYVALKHKDSVKVIGFID